MVINLLKKFRAAVIWSKMRRHYMLGDFSAAAQLACDYRKTGVESAVFTAFDGTLDVLNHNSESALEKYRRALTLVNKIERGDKRYVYEYCMYSIKLIENNLNEAERHRILAKSLNASKYVTESLPLSDTPLTVE